MLVYCDTWDCLLFGDSNDPTCQPSTGITGRLTQLMSSTSKIILIQVNLDRHITSQNTFNQRVMNVGVWILARVTDSRSAHGTANLQLEP